MPEISQNDVKALYDNASPERRAILAQKIGVDLDAGELSETEYDLALAICEQLANDVEVTVRQTLSEAIKSSNQIPKELAVKLANDVVEVSIPVLEFSEILDDDDLVAIARTGGVQRQLAITHRKSVSPVLSHVLVEAGSETVVDSLLKNDGADLVGQTYETVINRFKNSPAIHTSLAQRNELPKHVIEKMIDVVSDSLKSYLASHHDVSNILLEHLVLESREDAKRRLIADPLSRRDVEKIVFGLAKQDKLTTDLIFRALEVGDRDFFEYSLAQRAGIPVDATRTLIKDPGGNGFPALYKRVEMPEKDFNYIRYLVDIEYHSKRTHPITAAHTEEDSGDWVSETDSKGMKGH